VAKELGKANRGALWAIVAEGFFSRLSFGLITFALPLYAYEKFGLSFAEIGVLAAFNQIVAIGLKPFMGALADRIGLKRGLNIAIVLRSVVTLVLAFAAVPAQIFVARGIHGASISLRDPTIGALLAEHGGKKQVAQSFAWYQTAKTFAGNGSKTLSGILLGLTASNYSLVFLVAFALSLIPLAVVVFFVHETRAEQSVSAAEVAAPTPHTGINKKTIASFTSLGCMISGSAYLMNSLFPLFAVQYAGLTKAEAGFIYGVSPVMSLAGPGFGWLADNVSHKLVLSVRSVANVMSSIVYLLVPSLGGVIVGRATDDLGKAAFKPAWGSLLAQLSDLDKKRRGQLFGFISSGEDTGEALGPMVGGVLVSLGGFQLMLFARIVIAAVTEVYTVIVTHSLESHGRTRTGRETYRVSIAIPVRVVAGLLLSFGAGWAAGQVTSDHSQASAKEATPAEEEPRPAEGVRPRCSSDPTVAAIQKQLHEC